MTKPSENTLENKLQFWNGRAELGTVAGSDDFILKELEIAAILARVPTGARVLDVGCGNGDTLIKLARDRGVSGMGLDFAEKMVGLATQAATKADLAERLQFRQGKLPGLDKSVGMFDIILSQRCLINLDGAEAQRAAARELMAQLKPGGRYLMVESFQQGLDRTNALRKVFELETMSPPWHNIFIDEEGAATWGEGLCTLEERVSLSSTYHLLSRVVYAKLAKDRGEALRYDSEINMLALKLPAIGDLGPVKLYSFRRDA